MATQMPALRRKAKAAGVSASAIRGASSEAELKALISSANGVAPRKSTARKAVRKAVVRKSRTAKKSPAAKSTTGKAKRTSITKPKARSNSASGRNLINSVDYDKTKGWNPRTGSPPDRIMKALKKYKGNREKAFDALLPDVWDFVGKVKRNGDKRTKQEAADMLRYRISRTLFDFVNQTKQHKTATNRIEYGTGPHAKPKRGRPARKAAQTAPKRRGRPPGSKNKPKAQATPVKRGRGRPKGSKNKPK
jgi:hypothetical protein